MPVAAGRAARAAKRKLAQRRLAPNARSSRLALGLIWMPAPIHRNCFACS
jgi:hypothetical protein